MGELALHILTSELVLASFRMSKQSPNHTPFVGQQMTGDRERKRERERERERERGACCRNTTSSLRDALLKARLLPPCLHF